METTIETLRPHEADLIGKIIAGGFADDPVNLWAFNSVQAMRPAFTTMAKHLYLPQGFGHKSSDGKAGALWLPPGKPKDYGPVATVKMALAIAWHGGPKAIRNTLKLDDILQKKRPANNHYYLFAISVHPSLQGQGIGSRLMRPALDQVDAAKMPAYLESSKESNIGFYQNHGFKVVERITLGPDGPPMWLMWRDAQ